MFLLITPREGNVIAHEAEYALEVTTTPNYLYLAIDYTDNFKYPLEALQCWQGYPSREAALVDGADLRGYPGME